MSTKKQIFIVVFIICLISIGGGTFLLHRDTSIQIDQTQTEILEIQKEEVQKGDMQILNTWDNEEELLSISENWLNIWPISVSDYRNFDMREVTTSTIVDNLDAPWAFAFLLDGDILVTERFGALQLIQDGNITEVNWLPEVYTRGQWWLLDITIHPNFVQNNYIYLSYAHGTEEANRLRVVRARLNETGIESTEIIFESAQTKNGSSHFGSRFARLPDNTLVFSVGDWGNPPIRYNDELIRKQAQYLSSHLGKIIRINDDGSIPENNPFVGRPDVQQEIFSYGHRNIQWLAYDTTRNRLIASEHGSKWWDELNQIVPGGNYWRPEVSYATEYNATWTPISEEQSRPEFVDPLAVWTPTVAPSSVVVYSGKQYPDLQWDIFLAAMLLREDNSFAAYASRPAGEVFRLDTDDSWNIINQYRISVWNVRVRSIGLWLDGYLYVLTDGTSLQNRPGVNKGSLIRIDTITKN